MADGTVAMSYQSHGAAINPLFDTREKKTLMIINKFDKIRRNILFSRKTTRDNVVIAACSLSKRVNKHGRLNGIRFTDFYLSPRHTVLALFVRSRGLHVTCDWLLNRVFFDSKPDSATSVIKQRYLSGPIQTVAKSIRLLSVRFVTQHGD